MREKQNRHQFILTNYTRTHAHTHTLQRMSKHALHQEEDTMSAHQKCLFKSSLMLETDELYFEPSCNEFQSALKVILCAFQDCTLAVPNLLPDPFFYSFTRYVRELTCRRLREEQSVRKEQVNIQFKLSWCYYIPMQEHLRSLNQEHIRTGDLSKSMQLQ